MYELQFGPIHMDQQDSYRRLLEASTAIASDYSFINLWSWAEAYGLQWTMEDDLVWIRQTLPETLLWAPVGNWADVDWPQRLHSINENRASFIRVPEPLLSIWQSACPGRIWGRGSTRSMGLSVFGGRSGRIKGQPFSQKEKPGQPVQEKICVHLPDHGTGYH